jgi:hypothetical protein
MQRFKSPDGAQDFLSHSSMATYTTATPDESHLLPVDQLGGFQRLATGDVSPLHRMIC